MPIIQTVEAKIRARLKNNGRNPENNNEGIRCGSDLDYLRVLLNEIDRLRAELCLANGVDQ
jgi:hypothetical protein